MLKPQEPEQCHFVIEQLERCTLELTVKAQDASIKLAAAVREIGVLNERIKELEDEPQPEEEDV